jgi:hypothetical protein
VLSAYTQTPVVPESAVGTDLPKSVEILAHLEVEDVGDELRVLAVLVVLLPVEKVVRNLELARALDDCHHAVDLLIGQLARALVQVHVGLLQHQVREAAADTLDGRQRKHHLVAALDVGVEDAQDMLELVILHDNSHRGTAACVKELGTGVTGPCEAFCRQGRSVAVGRSQAIKTMA